MSRSRVNIRDVAAHAGVSHQTVSRVINESERVSPETRRKVQAAIQELGFVPSAAARSMARGRTLIIGCLSPNLTDYTFASIIQASEHQARLHGYFMVSSSSPEVETFSSLINELVGKRRVEGLVVLNPYEDERHNLVPDQVPTVYVGSRPRQEEVDSVALDDVGTGRDATRYLIELGHRNIAMITGPMNEDCSQDRSNGYKEALAEAGLQYNPKLVGEGDWSATSGHEFFKELIDDANYPSAVFAQNDRMAVGVIRAARENNWKVPDKLSVIGVDDMPLASYFHPPLTTMQQDLDAIGRKAVNLLISSIEDERSCCEHLLIPSKLVVRKSTCRITG
jgi:DNA-binding LacI/PurR family transcriptional regulator